MPAILMFVKLVSLLTTNLDFLMPAIEISAKSTDKAESNGEYIIYSQIVNDIVLFANSKRK